MRCAKYIRKTFLLILLAVMAGCSAFSKDVATKALPEPAPGMGQITQLYRSMPPSEGSLWTDAVGLLFVDPRARQVGDTVIIDIVENASSQMDVNTEATRESGIDVDVPNFTGEANINKYMSPDKLFEAKYKSEHKGEADSDRSGRITASIGGLVTQVLPNGNLVIYGRRDMKVNSETQHITVSGIARPEDITGDNRIKSTYLADARIEYYGTGALADKQRPGWGTRVMDFIWPF